MSNFCEPFRARAFGTIAAATAGESLFKGGPLCAVAHALYSLKTFRSRSLRSVFRRERNKLGFYRNFLRAAKRALLFRRRFAIPCYWKQNSRVFRVISSKFQTRK